MLVSSKVVYNWADMFSMRQGSDSFSQKMRSLGTEIMRDLEQSPTAVVDAPYKIDAWISDLEFYGAASTS